MHLLTCPAFQIQVTMACAQAPDSIPPLTSLALQNTAALGGGNENENEEIEANRIRSWVSNLPGQFTRVDFATLSREHFEFDTPTNFETLKSVSEHNSRAEAEAESTYSKVLRVMNPSIHSGNPSDDSSTSSNGSDTPSDGSDRPIQVSTTPSGVQIQIPPVRSGRGIQNSRMRTVTFADHDSLIIILGLSAGTRFGYDARSFVVRDGGEQFRGIKDVPTGAHFIWGASKHNSLRTGCWVIHSEENPDQLKKVTIKEWDDEQEVLKECVVFILSFYLVLVLPNVFSP